MAKRHLKDILTQLKRYYDTAEELYTNFAKETQDMIISDEDMQPMLDQKIRLDNTLTLYSTGIRFAMYNQLDLLIEKEQNNLNAFTEPLAIAIDNLSDRPDDNATQALIKSYNDAIKSITTRINTLNYIKFVKDLPNRETKTRKLLTKKDINLNLFTRSRMGIPIEAELELMKRLYDDYLDQPIEETTKGDMDE
jgi:ribosome-associated translation inhibitor RaiA